jgi:hypothetical protein
MSLSTAEQRPSTHEQCPPQSSVFGRHSIVHITAAQFGAWAFGTHAEG